LRLQFYLISEPEEASKKPIVIGVVTSAAFLILLVMGVIYWKLCYGDKNTRERGIVPQTESSLNFLNNGESH